MSNPFFSIPTLMSGGQQMLELIKDCAEEINEGTEETVYPDVKPGFLRKQLPENPPEEGKSVEHLIQMTKNVLFPGTMKWQSPKFFGYYPSTINVTNIFGDMFHVINHTPMFSYATAPVWTELENIVVDWSAKALGLPEQFLFKNTGGGVINNSTSQSIFYSAHIAKYAKRRELKMELDNPDIVKLVGYFGEGSHLSSEKALATKDIFHRRAVPYIYNKELLNYEMDVDRFQKMVEQDVKKGLIPFWFGFSYGNTFCAAIDATERAFKICKKYNIWINLDATWLGTTWMSEGYRPPKGLLEYVDTLEVNFSKLGLNGAGGALFFVKDKTTIVNSFGAWPLCFPDFNNPDASRCDNIDYKDWMVGFSRRNNALKFYYTFDHYGIGMIREAIEGQQQKVEYLLSLIKSYPALFKLHTIQFGVQTFHVLDKNGVASSELTRKVNIKIGNLKEGFSSPGEFKGTIVIRFVVGHYHTNKQHIKDYFIQIVKATQKVVSNEKERTTEE